MCVCVPAPVCASLCRYVETPIVTDACKQCHPNLLQRTGKVKYMVVQWQKGRGVFSVLCPLNALLIVMMMNGTFTTDSVMFIFMTERMSTNFMVTN